MNIDAKIFNKILQTESNTIKKNYMPLPSEIYCRNASVV